MIAHLFVQQQTGQFGEKLKQLLTCGDYQKLTIVMAFARNKGILQLQQAIEEFLSSGTLTVIVGISGKVTSYEALESLLSIAAGKGEISVFHNSHPNAGIFHPKIYLFEGRDKVALLVGSNNLTEPGLFTNYEAMCVLEFGPDEGAELLQEVNEYIATLLSNSKVARPLTKELLNEMLARGYVQLESSRHVSEEEAEVKAAKKLEGESTATDESTLFGAVGLKQAPTVTPSAQPDRAASRIRAVRRPDASAEAAPQPTLAPVVQVLTMRPFPQRNGTQIQVPRETEEFFEARAVRSSHTNEIHTIRPARTRGGINTLKLEIPECRTLTVPIVVFEKRGDQISYTALEGSGGQGAALMATLQAGLADGTTRRTRSDSTMWRID